MLATVKKIYDLICMLAACSRDLLLLLFCYLVLSILYMINCLYQFKLIDCFDVLKSVAFYSKALILQFIQTDLARTLNLHYLSMCCTYRQIYKYACIDI